MNGYPFLDNKLEFHHTTVAADVMRPRPTEKDPLWALPQDSMTVEELEHVVQSGPNGFPIVVSRENQYLVGFVLRKELQVALGKLLGHFAVALLFGVTLFPLFRSGGSQVQTYRRTTNQSICQRKVQLHRLITFTSYSFICETSLSRATEQTMAEVYGQQVEDMDYCIYVL